jgi:hypothetical protein
MSDSPSPPKDAEGGAPTPQKWVGMKLVKTGPERYKLLTRLPAGPIVAIPLGRFGGRFTDQS